METLYTTINLDDCTLNHLNQVTITNNADSINAVFDNTSQPIMLAGTSAAKKHTGGTGPAGGTGQTGFASDNRGGTGNALNGPTSGGGNISPIAESTTTISGYSEFYSLSPAVQHYKECSSDITKEIKDSTYLGFALALLIFSVYFFSTTSRLIRSKLSKPDLELNFDIVLYLLSLAFISSWTTIIIAIKDIPASLILTDVLMYPKQYLLGIVIASSILSVVAIYRHILLLGIFQAEEDTLENKKGQKLTIVNLSFSVINLAGSVVTIIQAMFRG